MTAQNPGGVRHWPSYLASRTNYLGRGFFTNIATGGEKATDMASQFNSQALPALSEYAGRTLFFIWAGTNDIASSTQPSDATVLARLRVLWQAARAAGMLVVAFTITPRSNPTIPTAQENAYREALNVSIRSSGSEYDALVDVAALFTDSLDTGVFYDGLHLTEAAHEQLAGWINANVIPKNFL